MNKTDETAAVLALLDEAAKRAKALAESDWQAFGRVYASAELTRQSMTRAIEKIERQHTHRKTLSLVRDMVWLRDH